jgi:hypothetical protein
MQAVEPRAALPYWDYTVDATACDGDLGCMQKTSAVFTEMFLGNSNTSTEKLKYRVSDGAFAGTPIPRAGHHLKNEDLWPEHNVFGMLTNTYNWNPATELQRSIGEWCGSDPASTGKGMMFLSQSCGTISDAMGQTTLPTFYGAVQNVVHGASESVHTAFGGATDCAASFDDLKTANETYYDIYGGDIAADMLSVWTAMAVNVGSLVVPNTTCQTEEPKFGIPACMPRAAAAAGVNLDELTQNELWNLLDESLTQMGVQPSTYGVRKDTEREVLRVLCKLWLFVGALTPMGTPYASTNDPLFFVLHAVYDRMWTTQVLKLGDEFNSTWYVSDAAVGWSLVVWVVFRLVHHARPGGRRRVRVYRHGAGSQ